MRWLIIGQDGCQFRMEAPSDLSTGDPVTLPDGSTHYVADPQTRVIHGETVGIATLVKGSKK